VLAVLTTKLPRKGLLIALMATFALGNAASAIAGSYGLLFLARFAAGLPHGAYFGVASLVAAAMVPPNRKGRAISQVMMGISVSQVVGVPFGTWMGQELGWRLAFWSVAALGVLTFALVAAFVPVSEGNADASWRTELRAFKLPQVWLTLLAGAIGFGGMFAVYSYIAPTVTEVAGLHESAVPIFLFVFGIGSVLGMWLAGVLADWSVFRALLMGAAGLAVVLALFWVTAPTGWGLLPAAFLTPILGSLLVMCLQLRLMEVAGDAKTLGAAMNHASLNIANALGAWLGGVVIAAGYGYRSPALAGIALSIAGLLVILASARLHLKTR
jgi:DHA1 family inner membrane transport protein